MKLDCELRFKPKSQQSEVLVLAAELAKPFESCKLRSYWDVAGYPTNGWGNLLSRETKHETMRRLQLTSKQVDEWLRDTYPDITQEQADLQLDTNLMIAYKAVLKLVKVALSAKQLAALVDFSFNLGSGNLKASTLLKMINREEFLDAADQFLRWNKAGGIVYKGLTRRRIAERALFLRGCHG